jgi:isoquinoline 1-oxidoreductase beta subunit
MAEISIDRKAHTVQVHRVVAAVDCGRYVSPETIRAQIEGGIGYGLSTALKGEITVANGRVEQSNFNDYDLLRINETPQTRSAHRAEQRRPWRHRRAGHSSDCPSRVHATTGKPVRRLPIRAEDLA